MVARGQLERTWLAVGVGGTKAGEDREAAGAGTVWLRPQQTIPDSLAHVGTALNRCHPVPWTAPGAGRWGAGGVGVGGSTDYKGTSFVGGELD